MEIGPPARRPPPALLAMVVVGFVALCPLACERSKTAARPAERPNVLWVVWDTVRADHLSLYGYEKPTTPLLEEWARRARVFDNCTSTAPYTTPSHASMFTGLLPSEHGVSNSHEFLDGRYTTIAELLSRAGYQTYLYSANPHVSRQENFHQGFDVTEHPWDPKHSPEALRIVQSKISPLDRSSELPRNIRAAHVTPWGIKATGELTQQATQAWLRGCDPQRPFFIFLNYMEAHRPYIPPESHRRRVMSPDQVALSYQVDRSWVPMWSYTFGLSEYTQEQIAIMAATYDATLAELDDLFHNLLTALEAGGHLDNTIVILTSDHGEHLGEHHILDHQYSVYNPVVRVPLVIHYPKRFPPGRDARPVVNFDLFPTLLELAGSGPPAGLQTRAVSLLSPLDERLRLAEYPGAFVTPFRAVRRVYPGWDPRPWQRTLRTLFSDHFKYIWASDGRHELYNLREDPLELNNLIHRSELAEPLAARLAGYVATLRKPAPTQKPQRGLSEEQLRRLAALGYVDVADEEEDTGVPASRPAEGDP